MNLPEIAIYNFSDKSDPEVQRAVRAVNRQVIEDFIPVWGAGYLCSLQTSVFTSSPGEAIAEEPVTADAAIYIVDESHLPGAAGYHFLNGREVPYGFVFTDAGQWTVTLSHEVLELIVDPNANAFVPGPDPRPGRTGTVLHTYEVCDAVERTTYLIDGVAVSNFVTKQYFVEGDGSGTRNDFLGTSVTSFGLLPGCHLGFFDLDAGQFVVHTRPGLMTEVFDAMPKLLAAKRKAAIETMSEPRLTDKTEAAVRASIEKTKDEGVRDVLRYALRRDAYRVEAEAIRRHGKGGAAAHP
jgi:hypothetical protein